MFDLALSGLIGRHAELAGGAEALATRCDQVRADLAHYSASIRIMKPSAGPGLIRPRKPSRKGCDWFGRQELSRLILDTLRDNGQPLSPLQLAQSVIAVRA